jgi:AcrR family transcriptional regulator
MAKAGRPRSFDRQEALRRAMNVFWALGYEGTTLVDLLEAMENITPTSFYAAFGSKEELQRVPLSKRSCGPQ